MSDGSFPRSEESSSYYHVKYTILRSTKQILGRSPLEAENIGLRVSRPLQCVRWVWTLPSGRPRHPLPPASGCACSPVVALQAAWWRTQADLCPDLPTQMNAHDLCRASQSADFRGCEDASTRVDSRARIVTTETPFPDRRLKLPIESPPW